MAGYKLRPKLKWNEFFILELQGVDSFGRNFAGKWFWILVDCYGSR